MDKKQTIGCDVVNCVYNREGTDCGLEHIEVSCSPERCGENNDSQCASFRGEKAYE